nr:K185 [uncultured bacterium]
MIPILIVSGFLGAGKTSLVRWLLAEANRNGKRMAVISNEFNALGIDQALLGAGGAAVVQLDGGCVCCQLSDDLVETLEMLRKHVNPDQIIIETSGVALPGETQVQLWREPVQSWISGDFAVVVVNAEQVLEERDLEGTFEYQITSADLLVLNKVDLVPADALPAIEARLREIEPEAPMVRSLHGQVAAEVLFLPDLVQLRRQRRQGGGNAVPHIHESFTSEIVAIENGVNEASLVARFRSIGALRAKGFVRTAAGLRLLQAVGGRVQLHDVAAPPDAALLGSVVVIRRAE